MKALPERSLAWLGGLMIVLAGVAAYGHALSGPFVLDDIPSILENGTLRQLWPLSGPLAPPRGGGLTVEGRPVLNLSLAVNHAIGGTEVRSYHLANLAIHLLAGLVLFGLVRRTLGLALRWEPGRAMGFAWAVALLWTLHPLQTESVTYVIQRAESLMGLFYLLTLYGFARSLEGPSQGAWRALAVGACLLGMGTKEVMVSAPLMVFCFDCSFFAGSAREAWRRRRSFHLALAATWLLLAVLALGAGSRGGTAGPGSGVSAFQYWLTQPAAVARYLRLALWPSGQVFDYGALWVAHPSAVALPALLLACLAGATAWALGSREPARRMAGFLGLWFFAILAPTSLIPGNRQTLAEHRMYLALIPVVIAGVAALSGLAPARRPWLLPALALLLALPCGFATAARNRSYRSALALYSADAARLPANPFAQSNLGMALLGENQPAAAAARFQEALRLRPVYPLAEDNLGNALLLLGRRPEAEAWFRAALRQDPNFAEAHNNLGYALLQEGQVAAALVEIETAIALKPGLAEARLNLAGALARAGRFPESFAQYRLLLTSAPGSPEVHNDFGVALAQAGDLPGAISQYRAALRFRPDYAEAHYNLANALAAAGFPTEAVAEYREAVRLRPDYLSACNNLGNALLRQGRPAEAQAAYEAALRIDPARALSHYNLANALLQLHRPDEAVVHYRAALRLDPDLAVARQTLERLRVTP